ncbi:hypothetical protein [Escherichia phage EC6]|jgi:hypothetical protein|uniref:Uncharacterized protein n=4 Tax=Felixounavirus TaxID=1198140 RepID=K4HZ30_9CAUD|nr:hypothetical protein [Staphylococcus hyicus]YP_009151367.1 hypothetical protein ACQ30_gp125 [Escherichia phage EC6]YP_009600342.1 hypothetical protein FDH39_gp027 [Salmonella phage Si3]AGF89434.1 hypothetical protein SP107_00320 [Salmonella phage FSL SP-107]EIY1698386.1 hypothetical protein [Shigella sonnei]QHR74696.1 hypothetical protein radambza_83 [Escherichia phage radambza]WVH07159.1 hypothetical protein JRYRANMO_CDS_0010 [Salmonella phage FM4b]AFU62456.1 hypothetical protein [Escher
MKALEVIDKDTGEVTSACVFVSNDTVIPFYNLDSFSFTGITPEEYFEDLTFARISIDTFYKCFYDEGKELRETEL